MGNQNLIIGSVLSAKTKKGLIEIEIEDVRIQVDVAKARVIYEMLGGAIESAISDEITWALLTSHGMSDSSKAQFLMELRELRQGSKGTVFIQ